MFTDIVGYTALTQANESLALSQLKEHQKLLRSIFSKFNGREVKTIGDAFLVEFSSVLAAVECAVEVQTRLRQRNLSVAQSERMLIRIGLHLGDVVKGDCGDILGDAVNISSRIEPLAEPGGVCISEQVFDQVHNKLSIQLEKLPPRMLKNVKVQTEVFKVVMPWEVHRKTEDDAPLDPRRIAVLPLKNMSSDANDEYFADGMTEELITSLSAIKQFTVIARTSVMQYKNATKRIAEIGQELKTGTLIEGSVRKASNKVRISVQLIDSRNEGHLWAQNYDKELDDVFAIQSEVAQKVADALKVRIGEDDLIERGPTKNPDAYDLYLQGMFYWNKRNREAVRIAIDLFGKALELDPNFAQAHAGIAQCYQVMGSNHYETPVPCYVKAREHALKALVLNSDLPEAHATLGAIYGNFERDNSRAEAEIRKAIELNPNYASAHQWYSLFLSWTGREAESEREIRKALELNPLSLVINTNYGDHFYYSSEFDSAIKQFKRVVAMDPAFSPVYGSLIQAYIAKSMFNEALQAAETLYELGETGEAKIGQAYTFAAMGKKDDAKRILRELADEATKNESTSPYNIALVYARLGDKEEAFGWLEKAYADYDRLLNLITIDYEFDELRNDPRYFDLIRRLGLAQYFSEQTKQAS